MMVTTVVSGRHAVPVDEPAEPEVPERATRRGFSAQYKLKILAEYERRDRDGRSALLRREGLYTSSNSYAVFCLKKKNVAGGQYRIASEHQRQRLPLRSALHHDEHRPGRVQHLDCQRQY